MSDEEPKAGDQLHDLPDEGDTKMIDASALVDRAFQQRLSHTMSELSHKQKRNGGRIMNMRGFWLGLVIGTFSTCLLGQWGFSAASKETDPPKCISPKIVADYIHSVVQADRTFYTTEIVDRMQARGLVFASEHWREDGDLPLPAQFLLESGRLVAKQSNGIRFRLISSWPINKRNGPMTEFERTALMKIVESPNRPYTGVTTEGKSRVYQALYPDKALSSNCADCHNVHPESPKRDFKAGDVMGGILLTIPIPQSGRGAEDERPPSR